MFETYVQSVEVPSANVTVAHCIELNYSNGSLHPWSTHWANLQDGGRGDGHYFEYRIDAEKDFVQRVIDDPFLCRGIFEGRQVTENVRGSQETSHYNLAKAAKAARRLDKGVTHETAKTT